MLTNWFLDFDDTLASGSTTWGLKYALPKLIRENGLTFDKARFERAVLTAQEKVVGTIDPRPVVDELFVEMGWPASLQKKLIADVMNAYRPELFADTVPFLDKLIQAQCKVYLVSNNPRSPAIAHELGIKRYFTRFFTPDTSAGAIAKPDPRVWDYIVGSENSVTRENSALIGDDPWTDGVFAARCNLTCFLIDRDRRFAHLHNAHSCHWVESLIDIPVG